MGFGLSEVLSSLTLLRKHVLTYPMDQGVWHGTLDVYRVLELEHRVILFFDKAMYHATRGYCESQLNERAARESRSSRKTIKAPRHDSAR
jgi:hypothetical protein